MCLDPCTLELCSLKWDAERLSFARCSCSALIVGIGLKYTVFASNRHIDGYAIKASRTCGVFP